MLMIMAGNIDDDVNVNQPMQKAAPLPALDLAIVLKELTIAGFNVYRSWKNLSKQYLGNFNWYGRVCQSIKVYTFLVACPSINRNMVMMSGCTGQWSMVYHQSSAQMPCIAGMMTFAVVMSTSGYWYDAHHRWLKMDGYWRRVRSPFDLHKPLWVFSQG